MLRALLTLIAAAAALSLLACAAPAAEARTIELIVMDPPAATRRVEVPLGTEITLRITAPSDDRAHVHGYEIEQDLVAGEPTDIVFEATMSGTYEVELHLTDIVVLDLVVT